MSRNFKKPFILSDTHLDDLAIRGVKFIRTAHFGDLFETKNAPYDYVQKIKKLKLIKTVITHKVDRSNVGTVNLIVRQHQKLLTSLKDYGSSTNTALKKTARLIRNPEQVKVRLDIKSLTHFLRYHRDVENLHLEEGEIEPEPEEGEDDDRKSEDEDYEKILKLVKRKAWRLRKLKTIEMEGDWDEEFSQFLQALEANSQALISLKDIKLKSITVSQHFRPCEQFQTHTISKYIKEIEVAFGDLHSVLLNFVRDATVFPGLEKLTGVISLQNKGFNYIQNLAQFKSLKHLNLFFHKDERNSTQQELVNLLSLLRLPETLEAVDLHFTELDSSALLPLAIPLPVSFNLPALHSISLATTVSPYCKSENVITLLKMALNNAKNFRNLKLEIESQLSQNLKEFFYFKDCLSIIEQSGVHLDSLALKLPYISLEGVLENGVKLDTLSHLSLSADNCIQDSDDFNSFLARLNPATIKTVVLNEIQESTAEKLIERLTILQKFDKLEKLSLVYKNITLSNDLIEAFRVLLSSLPSLTYFVFKYGKNAVFDQAHLQNLMNSFFLEKPNLSFSIVEA